MDLNAVRMLVQVADARSFTLAAGQLGISQSGLSRAISRLESALGVRLLHRNTRNVSLTPDGRQFVEHCAPLLSGLEDAERRLGDRPSTPSGVLKLTAPSMFGRKVLVPLAGQLMAAHPQLQFELVLNDRLVDLVEEGFDAALRTGPISDVRMVARPLRPLNWVTVASPAYIAQHGEPATVDALHDHACLAVRNLRSGRLVDWQFREGDGQLREFTPPARMVFDSGDPLVEGALAGIGIVQVMDFAVADALADGRLQRVLQPFEGRSRVLSLVYPPSRQASPKLQVLAEALLAGNW
ncbi:LysR family transcriptional regulator [Stenotrophomonas maltophilia]|jgi:DNA-binding transcriptional LysR family regulator|uniref:LysR family transcriptional regulator n=1 Tax=Stenotrophomonas maltophilia TaxID=40324 RepID=A0A246HIQ0_STEMA|nr:MULTISPECIES: LysR family transcriptional regulator [Stenotrophomonas]MBW8375839.1 LysR family transcriptional regulator [Stenotrophomonas sp.]OWQ50391.1 LysR family transcriptional regulator [Stenotrophomonas maltophilia]